MRGLVFIISLIALGACSVLPHDGPSTRAVKQGATHGGFRYALIALDYPASQVIASQPDLVLQGLSRADSRQPNDLIAGGDVLAVSVFEAGGGSLFGRPPDQLAQGAATNQQTFARLVVDPQGFLTVPFAGQVRVEGLTPLQADAAIRRALRGVAVDPQVGVTVVDSRANSVIVLGEVRASGHYPLTAHNDTLVDALASAGGPTRPAGDLDVTVQRGALRAEVPFSTLLARPADNIRLAPQDQVRVLYKPRRYSTFGALSRITQTIIEDDTSTLAAAISRAGGLDTQSANASAVLIFRFERPDIAAALGVTLPPAAKGVPIVYRLDLTRADGFFVANNFDIRPEDLLYVTRSDLTETEKFLNVVNTATQIGYNVRVTGITP